MQWPRWLTSGRQRGSPVQRPDVEHALLLAGAEAVAAHVVRVVHVVPSHTQVGYIQLQLADLDQHRQYRMLFVLGTWLCQVSTLPVLRSRCRAIKARSHQRNHVHLIGSVPGMAGHVLRGEQKNAEEDSGCVSWTMSPGPSQSLPLNVWYSPSQWPVGATRTVSSHLACLRSAARCI